MYKLNASTLGYKIKVSVCLKNIAQPPSCKTRRWTENAFSKCIRTVLPRGTHDTAITHCTSLECHPTIYYISHPLHWLVYEFHENRHSVLMKVIFNSTSNEFEKLNLIMLWPFIFGLRIRKEKSFP